MLKAPRKEGEEGESMIGRASECVPGRSHVKRKRAKVEWSEQVKLGAWNTMHESLRGYTFSTKKEEEELKNDS